MKKSLCCVIVFFAALLMVGCGASSSSNGGGGGGGNVIVRGALSSGSIANLAVKGIAKADTPASDYTVVAVDNSSNKTYQATTNEDGTFSIEVPSDSSYLMAFVNNGSYIGPAVFDGSDSQVNTAIKPTASTDLGSMIVDEDEGYARAETAPAIVDTEVLAEAADGKPKGAGPDNDGKVQNAGITNREDSDEDKDGIPNIFDADEDNDGFRNGIKADPSGKTVVSDHIESVYMSSNIWPLHGEEPPAGSVHSTYAPSLMSMWLNVVPKSGQESTVVSVTCTDVPAVIKDVATVRVSSSIGDPVDYPTGNSLWKDSGYNLYKTTTLAREQWIISLAPNAAMTIGDTFVIKVTYTDSSNETFYIPMSYILTDWASITIFNGTSIDPAKGSRSDPQTFSGDPLTIEFTKPRDEDGNILSGLSYSVQYAISTCSGGTCNVPTTKAEPGVTDTGADTLSFEVPTPDASGTTYYVTPVAESADGQRNGEQTWFTKQ